ncbi:glycosyltransferase [Polynucleobacter alcilacus]|uniref:glycosyltransferase n=1 Tax=Polynucleobacter alcilacus TaxID=1819739 RepID=UPI001C0AC0C7|nr:glycosyltransferase [Polynucleobacter alcilacus]MBU3568195.1 glycosyltransferase [Polynucleobacter alcilacus]
MKITIITSTYNCGNLIGFTADSIRMQNNKNFQWIVVDGMSTDETSYHINLNKDLISVLIQEVDNGVYDAWNKACDYIAGDWVIFLGAGDTFVNGNVLTEFSQFLKSISIDIIAIYGNVEVLNEMGEIRYIDSLKNLEKFKYGRPILPNHQGVFHSNSLFKGSQKTFDDSLKIAGDTKFLLEALRVGKFEHINLNVTKMIGGGISNSHRNIFLARNEIREICKQLKIQVPIYHLFVSDISWIIIYCYNLIVPKNIKKITRKFIDIYRGSISK